MKPSVVTVANEQVSIATVCRLLGVEVPEETGRSLKLHCPFEHFNHSDGGLAPAMRIYLDSNSAYCFACSQAYTPVKMYAWATENGNFRAVATKLLDSIGYRPVDPVQAWQRAQVTEQQVDRSQLAEALKTFCRRVDPAWRSRQFDPVVSAQLSRCLGLLDLVQSADDVSLWLTSCKRAMRQTLVEVQEPS